MKFQQIFLISIAVLALGACSSDFEPPAPIPEAPEPEPTPPDPVVPPEAGEAPAVVISGVITSRSGALVDEATISFLENGAAATNVVSLEGDPISEITTDNGTFAFTVAEGVSLNAVTIEVTADGFFPEDTVVDLSSLTEDTDLSIELNPSQGEGVSSQTSQASVSGATVAEAVSVESSTPATKSQVTVPANTQLLDSNGAPISGSSVSLSVTVADNGIDEDATDEEADEKTVAADLIPPGLIESFTVGVGDADAVPVPQAVANISITDDQGTEVTQFSQPISITIDVPADGELAEGDTLTVSSYDEDTDTWATEGNVATLGPLDAATNTFPATFETDHLTLFTLSGRATSCPADRRATVSFTGDAIPAGAVLESRATQNWAIALRGEGVGITGNALRTTLTEGATSATPLQGVTELPNSTRAYVRFTLRDSTGFVLGRSGITQACAFSGVNRSINVTLPPPPPPQVVSISAVCQNDNSVTVDSFGPSSVKLLNYYAIGPSGGFARYRPTATDAGDGVVEFSQEIPAGSTATFISNAYFGQGADQTVRIADIFNFDVTDPPTTQSIVVQVPCAGGTGGAG